MRKKTNNIKAYHFPGISVLIPREYTGFWVEWTDKIPVGIPNQHGFELVRFIGNIDLFHQGVSDNEVHTFDPPIEFRVGYTFDDERKANFYSLLKLAYWPGKNNEWVIISNPALGYQIFPSSTAPVAEVKIASWPGDPTLAWGK